MNRKKKGTEGTATEIKPAFSIHLEELLKEKGLQKKELAAKIYTSPQTISKACQGIRITRPIAESIVKLFPEYYIGWVLGWEGSPKYLKDVQVQIESAEKKARQIVSDLHEQFFDGLALVCNSNIHGAQVEYANGSLTIKSAVFPEPAFPPRIEIEGAWTPISVTLEEDETKALKQEIQAYLNYRLSTLISQKHKTVKIIDEIYLASKEGK